ncbi:MAG: sporulation initiation factor Spo0A C-terminal domain-containing protein [Clostridia bacterium]|nr:sporulation initiation factor Spo0A C-terminal domain-containing protein [Clostridia bacterium]
MIQNKLDLISKITAMNDAEFDTLMKLLNGELPRTPVTCDASVTPSTKQSLYEEITNAIINRGFAANLKGYNYVRTALMIMVTEPETFNDQITLLYYEVGKRHNTTGSRTERAIRHSITSAYDRHPEVFADEFPSHMKAPTNSEFLYALADKLKGKYFPAQE